MFQLIKKSIARLSRADYRLSGREKFIYLHLPKTAGSAIKSAIASSPYADQFLCLPHRVGFSALDRQTRGLRTFLTVREPISWYASLYNFKIGSGKKGYSEMERNSLADFIDDVVLARNGAAGLLRWHRPIEQRPHVQEMAGAYFSSGANQHIGFLTVNLLYYATRDWRQLLAPGAVTRLLSRPGDVELGASAVLRQEQLQEDLDRLLSDSGISVSMEQRVNAMASNPHLSTLGGRAGDDIRARDHFIYTRFYR